MNDKTSTIRVKESTKRKLVNLGVAKKGMSYEEIVLALIKYYKKDGK
jgi:hypothetical protein